VQLIPYEIPFPTMCPHGMVPFENLVGVAMAAMGLMADIQILR